MSAVCTEPADIERRAGRADRRTATTAAGAAHAPGRPRLRPHRRLRRGRSPPGSPTRPGQAGPRRKSLTGTLAPDHALWRKPAPEGGLLPVTGDPRPGVASARQIQGKELSYNNIDDTDAAFELVAEFDPGRARRLRHHQARQPLRRGAGRLAASSAYARALQCDPVSAFGGIVASEPAARRRDGRRNRQGVHRGGDRAGRGRRRHRRIRRQDEPAPAAHRRPARSAGAAGEVFRSVAGGFLVQSRDNSRLTAADLKIVTKRAPTDAGGARHAVRLHHRQAREVQRRSSIAKDGQTAGHRRRAR